MRRHARDADHSDQSRRTVPGISIWIDTDFRARRRNRGRRSQSATHRASQLFDISLGDDNLFNGDRYKWSARISVVNLTDKYALYNFLSTFSGTHYVSPRAITGTIALHF